VITPQLILGGPGCGKTTRLLSIVREKLSAGVPPDRIAFVSFTKEAATVARDRAATEFSLSSETDLPWFRTIHSLAYKRLGLSRDEVMGLRDWREFAALVGEDISQFLDPEAMVGGLPAGTLGDKMVRCVDYAATTRCSLEEAWHTLGEAVEWLRLDRFARTLLRYKEETGKMDFNDMLSRYADAGERVPIQVAVIDEAQDLTPAQWQVVRRAFEGAEEVYVGGDDDQAIYRWAGADVEYFLELSSAPEVLPISHRLPEKVYHYARRISARIHHRYAKRFGPVPGRPGSVEVHTAASFVDMSEGTWLVLARNGYMLPSFEALIRGNGYTYSTRKGSSVNVTEVAAMHLWEKLRTGTRTDFSAAEARALCRVLDRTPPQLRELTRYTLASLGIPGSLAAQPWYLALKGINDTRRDYYTSVLRRGADKLSRPPRIRIDTIHGVKGAEADYVLVSPDMSDRTMKAYRAEPDAEHRVFYVAVTRARLGLHLLTPQTFNFYEWPEVNV
jgi:superfamily I DNA/RNA helicase